MKELIKITDDGVNARELYEHLEIKHLFRNWITNAIRDYGFIEHDDFSYFFNESTGGRPKKEYAISINMAKELAMVSKTKKGREARAYFIKCEEISKNAYINYKSTRLAGIETRKSLTDVVKDSGENERMHGRGYSNFTKLCYKLAGIEYIKQDNFRDTLPAADLERVKTIEKMMDALLSLGKQYGEIKDTLSKIFTVKQVEV